MVHGMRCGCPVGRPARRARWSRGGGLMSIVMGLDQHRAQITAEWLETEHR